jgi:NAD(P)-dependent dehydrogenase (short-subunit alcohol dehydrogenase family)
MGALDGKVALVTGSGQGLGFEVAQALAGAGAKLVLLELVPERVEARAKELRARGHEVVEIAGDVRERATAEAAVARTLESFGRLDVLVNAAQALAPPTSFMDHDDALFESFVRSGLFGTINLMQAAYPALKRQGGAVLNFGSGAGVLGNAYQSAYAATKEAIRGLSRAVAREWGADKIRVNVICPAANSPSFQEWFRDKPDELAAAKATMAMGRPAEGFEIGRVAAFLVSPDCFLTGQTVQVDGGIIMP